MLLGLVVVVGVAAVVITSGGSGGPKVIKPETPVTPISAVPSTPVATQGSIIRRNFTSAGPGAGTLAVSTTASGHHVVTVRVHGLADVPAGYDVWLSRRGVSTKLGPLHRASVNSKEPNSLSGSFRLPSGALGADSRVLVAAQTSTTSTTVGAVSLTGVLPAS